MEGDGDGRYLVAQQRLQQDAEQAEVQANSTMQSYSSPGQSRESLSGEGKATKRKKASTGEDEDGLDSDSISSLSGEEGAPTRRKAKVQSAKNHTRKRRKTKSGIIGKRMLRKYKGFQSCPVKVLSMDQDKCHVMYSDGEIEVISDEEALEELPSSMQQEIEVDAAHDEHPHDQAGNIVVEFIGSSGATLDPEFVAQLVRHLSKAKHNMTPQKYASKIDEANFPKYPTTSFGLYLASVVERDGSEAVVNGSEWSSMDAEEKRPYYEQHKANMQTYRAAIEAYKPGPVEKVALDTFKRAKQECQRLAKKRTATGVSGSTKPKRPMSAFLYFSQEERARWIESSESGKSMRSFQAQAAVKWRALSDEEKNKFQEMASQDQNRYRTEMDLFQNDNPNMDPKKNIQKEYFDKFIKKRIKILRKLNRAATGALAAMRERKRLEMKLRKYQRDLLRTNQEHGRWSYKIHQIRDKFPSVSDSSAAICRFVCYNLHPS